MSESSYDQIHNDDVFSVKLSALPETMSLSCCDCGLTHGIIAFHDPADPTVVYIQIKTDRRATGQLRRFHEYEFTPLQDSR